MNKCGGRGRLVTMVLMAGLAIACGGGKSPQTTPQADSATQARMAESLLKAGRISESLATIDEAIAADPENVSLHHMRGMILFRAGRYAEAGRSFLRVLELDPYYTDARNFLGAIYSEQNDFNEAEQQFRRALEDAAYPTPELVHLNLGLLYEKQGRDEEALGQLRTAVEIDPKFYRAQFELASLLDRMERLEEAVRLYEVAEPGFRSSGEFYYRLGLAYFRLGRPQKSAEALRRAIDVAPGSESAARADELLKVVQ